MTSKIRTYNPYRSCFETMSSNVAAELLRYGKSKPDCISLAQGEGSLPTPAFICDEVQKSLADGKKITVSLKSNVSLLSEISVYTYDGEKPLKEVMSNIAEKENKGYEVQKNKLR